MHKTAKPTPSSSSKSPWWGLALAWLWPQLCWASFDQTFEKARYLFEIEGNLKEAQTVLDQAEKSAQGLEKERCRVFRIEMLYAKGKSKEARRKLGQSLAHSPLPKGHLQTLQKRIGIDTLYQRVNLAQYQLNQIDTLLQWQGQTLLTYQNGLWQKWGQKPDPNQISLGSKFLFSDGLHLYSTDPSRRTLWIKTTGVEEDKRLELNSPISWSKHSGDRLLIWSGNQLMAMRGEQLLWNWQSSQGWCQDVSSTGEDQILLLCPKSQNLVYLNPEKAQWQILHLPHKALGALSLPGGALYYDENGISRFNSRSKTNLWYKALPEITQIHTLGAQILVKTRENLLLLESRSGKILKNIHVKGQHLSVLKDRIVLWKDNGYISFWDTQLEYLWAYQFGQGLRQDPVQIKDHIFVVGNNGHGVLLDGLYNGLQPTEQDGLIHKAKQYLSQGNVDEAYEYAQKVLSLEPGNAKAKLFNLENTSQPLSFAQLYQTLIQSGEDSLLQAATLKAMSQMEGNLWIAQMRQEHTAFPQFRYRYGRMWWIHPENSQLQSLNLNNGLIQAYSNTNSYPGLLQPMDIGPSQVVVAAGKHLDFYTTQGNFLYSSPDLPEAPLWVGHFGRQVVRVGRSGSIAYVDPSGAPQAFLAPLDHSAVIQIQRAGDVMDLFYRSGAWFRSIPKSRQWVHRHTAANVESAWSDESQAIISSSDRTLYSYGFDGVESWRSSMPSQVISIQANNDKVFVGLSNQILLALDRKSGQVLWTYQGRSSLFVKPLVLGNRLYLDQGQKLVVLDAGTGNKMNERNYPFRIGSIQSDGTSILITSATGLLMAYHQGKF